MKVRSDIMKLSKSMHTWVGVTAGILLFICFFAGGLSMFQHHFSKWATPQQQILPKIQISQYQSLIEQVQAQHPATHKAFTLNLQSDEFHHAPLTWIEKRGEGFDRDKSAWLASLDENGQLITQKENVSKAGWLIEQLHETAGIPGMIGHHGLGVYVMGVVSILYFLAIMSGLLILLPTLVKDYFAIRPGKNKKRFWLDTHNVVGITSLPFHIIVSITVIVFAFHDYFYDSFDYLANKNTKQRERPAAELIVPERKNIDIQAILSKVNTLSPQYSVEYMLFTNLDDPQKANARIALYSDDQMLRGANNDFMFMNPYNVNHYRNQGINTQSSAGNKAINALFSLHFGSYGGDFVRWVYVVLGLAGAFLFYSGNMLWVETRARKQKRAEDPIPQQRKDVKFLASLTIGACLGCILAITSTLLFGRWIYATLSIHSINQLFMNTYYLIFVTSILYTFIMGHAKALPHMFLFNSLAMLAIPLTSIIAYLIPSLELWSYGNDVIGIDIGAFIFSLFFFRFYQQAKDRALSANKGSLWAYKSL